MLWGIDLGGTKIEGVVFSSPSDPTPLCRIRVDTEQHKGYQHIINQIVLLVDQISDTVGERPSEIGIAHPGVVDSATKCIKNSNTVAHNGQPLTADLEKALRIKLHMANDANCFALAESRWGAAKGANSVFGVILGTGVGGGIVINGKVLHGAQGIAGEWGHNCLIPDGPECYCKRFGCVEAVISGPALQRYYATLSDKNIDLREIMRRADEDSEPFALQTKERLLEYFGKALAVVINIVDPEYVVLGGGLSNIHALYTEGLEEVKRNVFNDRLETKLVKNKLGDSAGVFGAALLCDEIEYSQ